MYGVRNKKRREKVGEMKREGRKKKKTMRERVCRF